MSNDSIIARRLLEARFVKGLSQKKLGIAAGIDEFSASPRINQYEKGKHTPDFATLERLGNVLGVPVAYFYATDNDLAKVIILYSKLDLDQKNHIVNFLVNQTNTE